MIQTYRLPTRQELLSEFFEKWNCPSPCIEQLGTIDAYGRILAEDIFALCDTPVYRASKMDGVAVKSSTFISGIPDATLWKPAIDYVRADTGADFPDDFDAVVRIEDVEVLPSGGLRFKEGMQDVQQGTLINPKGKSLAKGTPIGCKGELLTASLLAVITMGAVKNLRVYAKPRVVFIPTGSELIPLGSIPERGKKIDINSIMARFMLEEMGAEPIIYPIVPDNRIALSAALDKALSSADIVVLNAGSSKGKEDLNHTLLEEHGEFCMHGVAALPGKPLALATIGGIPVVNVAGPPVACFNGLDWCVRAIIRRLLKLPDFKRKTVEARLTEPIIHKTGGPFESIMRLTVELTDTGYIATPVPHWTCSPVEVLRTNGLYVTKIPPKRTEIGDIISVELLCGEI